MLWTLVAACSSGGDGFPSVVGIGGDREVTFERGGVTFDASLRLPDGDGPVAAALIVAGSGPTDRNGDNPLLAGEIGTLRHLADVLADHGVASLRYDKVGSGTTGMGELTEADLGFFRFVDDARAGLEFLAAQPGVDPDRLTVIGHSEGGLIAELLAVEAAPTVDVALVAPVPHRYLDVVTDQLERQLDQAFLPAAEADSLRRQLATAVADVRAGRRPDPTAPELEALFRPEVTMFLREADANDPVDLAKQIPRASKVLLACGDADIQVPCESLRDLRTLLSLGTDSLTVVELVGVNHVLKEIGDSLSTGREYGQPLPFSRAFDAALIDWISR
jgi:pimeloyl-ACP methyl ester carboxylesterase